MTSVARLDLTPDRQSFPVVLVVDDTPHCLELAQLVLEAHGVEVATASSGAEALTLCAARNFSAIFMDLHMPEMDGWTVTRAIREGGDGNSDTPIIAMSADHDRESRLKCRRAGVTTMVAKPYRASELTCAFEMVSRRDCHGL